MCNRALRNKSAIERCIYGMTSLRHLFEPESGELKIDARGKANKARQIYVMQILQKILISVSKRWVRGALWTVLLVAGGRAGDFLKYQRDGSGCNRGDRERRHGYRDEYGLGIRRADPDHEQVWFLC